jgi:hypothetical protein
MRAAIAFLALLSCFSVGCQHNLVSNGCTSCGTCEQGCSSCGTGCNSCGGGCNSCGNSGLLSGGGRRALDSRMHGGGQGMGLGSRLHGDGDGMGMGHGMHGDGQGLGIRSGAPQHVARMPHFGAEQETMGPPGPPTGAYAYPYYTVRAPRDFLLNNPPSIGP